MRGNLPGVSAEGEGVELVDAPPDVRHVRGQGGAVGRGPNRYYVEIHPERLRGFVDLATHPWIVAVSETVLGPRWRLHYFAHLDAIRTGVLSFVASGEPVGTLGASGNAQGKPPHLHYSIVRMLPAPWKVDGATQGYKKAFFIDPHTYLVER